MQDAWQHIKHILVATDLTDRSERACERGIRLARERAATVDLLHSLARELLVEAPCDVLVAQA